MEQWTLDFKWTPAFVVEPWKQWVTVVAGFMVGFVGQDCGGGGGGANCGGCCDDWVCCKVMFWSQWCQLWSVVVYYDPSVLHELSINLTMYL